MRNWLCGFGCSLALIVLATSVARAQRIQIPQNSVTDTFYQQGSVTGNPLAPVPQPNPQLAQTPSTTLGPPRFDPYATNPNAASQPPSLLSPSASSPTAGPSQTPFWQTPSPQGSYVQPSYPQGQYPQTITPPNYQVPSPTYGPGVYPQQPGVLFPNGINIPGWNLPQPQTGQYLRLFQDIRLTYTWVAGGDSPVEMDTNDIELATTVNFPNFFYSGQPLQVSPGFIFQMWDGPTTTPTPPDPIPATGAFPTTLPAQVYSAYLDFGWKPMLTPQFGGEVDFSMGVYSDYNTVTTDSVRFQGTGLLVLGLTPTVALKGGVTYLDRIDLKLLPAGGILWRPNPQTRFDIYFPKPKLAQYLTTIGNSDVWWYVNGEIGGGSWTVERIAITPVDPMDPMGATTAGPVGGDRRVDLNDYRVGGGFEWTCQSGVRGFVEAAYVFNRQLVFAAGPIATQDLDASVMVRGGLTY